MTDQPTKPSRQPDEPNNLKIKVSAALSRISGSALSGFVESLKLSKNPKPITILLSDDAKKVAEMVTKLLMP